MKVHDRNRPQATSTSTTTQNKATRQPTPKSPTILVIPGKIWLHYQPCTRKLLYTADTLSSAPDNNDTRLRDEAEIIMELCIPSLPASTRTLSDYLKARAEDYCQKGWLERKDKIATEFRPYRNTCSELTADKIFFLSKTNCCSKVTPEEHPREDWGKCLHCNIPILKEQQTQEWKYLGEFCKQYLKF